MIDHLPSFPLNPSSPPIVFSSHDPRNIRENHGGDIGFTKEDGTNDVNGFSWKWGDLLYYICSLHSKTERKRKKGEGGWLVVRKEGFVKWSIRMDV